MPTPKKVTVILMWVIVIFGCEELVSLKLIAVVFLVAMCKDWFQSSLLHTVTPWSIISQESDKNLIILSRGDAMWLIEKVKKNFI